MATKSPQEVLQTLKNVILSDKGISTKEKNNIEPRGLDQEVISEYVSKQKELYPLGGVVLERLLDSIMHVSREKMFHDLLIQSEKLLSSLSGKSDKRFYIILSGHKREEDMWLPDKGGCHFKSNMFMSIIMMNMTPGLVEHFVDFLCDETPIHGEYDATVKNLVYIDDATFSGSQCANSFNKLSKVLELENHSIHIVLLYIKPVAMDYINSRLNHNDIQWYTTETRMIPIKEILPGIMSIPGLDAEENHVKDIIYLFLKGSLQYHHVNIMKQVLEKPLFYTDMKMADEHSTWPFIYFLPTLVSPSLKLIDFEKSLITNCPYAGFMKATLVRYGSYCPVPTYKTSEWSDFITKFKF